MVGNFVLKRKIIKFCKVRKSDNFAQNKLPQSWIDIKVGILRSFKKLC